MQIKMARTSLFLITVSLIAVSASSSSPLAPGFQLRVTRRGLDYANRVASNLLNREIRSLRIPDFERVIDGGGRVRVKNIRMVNFVEPVYTYALNSPSTFTWKLENAAVTVDGEWWGKKRVVVLLEGKGTVTANASKVSLTLSAKFGRNGKNSRQPAIIGAKCISNIGKFQLDVKGGIIASVINVFKGQISAYLKPVIERQLCVRAREFLVKDANAKLATFPVKTAVHAFVLDYGLVSNPTVTEEYVEISLKGRILPSITATITSPHSPQPLAKTGDGNRMLYAWASDVIINDALYFAHIFNTSRYLITKDTPGAGSFLAIRCNASTSCLGSTISEIADMFPTEVETAEALLTTSTPPRVTINGDESASLMVDGLMDVYAYVPNANGSNVKKSIAVCSIEMKSDLRLRVENMRVVGSANISRFNVRIVESPIDPFTLMFVEVSLPGSVAPPLEKFVNQWLAAGVPIPVTRGVTLVRPEIRLLPNTVQVESDVQYIG